MDEDETVFMGNGQEKISGRILFPNEETYNKRMKSLYEQLGKAYYEGAFEDPLPQLLPLFDEITKVKKEWEEFRQGGEAQLLTEPRICPNCHEPLEEGALFCGNCGQKIR